MSRTRAYKQDTLDIQRRYFEIMQELIDGKRLPGGLAGFCETYGIDNRHWYAQRKNPSKGYFEVAWLIPLIKYYNVSANWLLFGSGKRFKRNTFIF